MEQQAIQALAILAKRVEMPKEQLVGFLEKNYVPLPWQLQFHAKAREADKDTGPTDIGVGGARGPGKSHCVFAQVALDDCIRVPGLKGLFLRQTGKSAEESFQDLIESVLRHSGVSYQFNSSKGILKFANGSRVLLGGFDNEDDIDKYVGIQYDVMAVEERNQLSGDKILKLKGSLRTVKPNWRARMYSSFNPGNKGHNEVKETFVVPFNAKNETTTRFVPSTYKDNPFLKREYIDYLFSLPGALGKAWREGNFDTFEGQYFIEWDVNQHTVRPFGIPETWKRMRSYDYGYDNPACCKWYALDYDGRMWVYREKYWPKGHKTDAAVQAQEIVRLSEGETYEYSVADPSIFSPTGMVDKWGSKTIAETFMKCGVTFIPASNRRIDGWSVMHEYLKWDEKQQPKIKYFNTCFDSIRTLPNLIHSEIKPEDVDTDGEDHAADVDRYILISLHDRKTKQPLTAAEKTLEQMKRNRGENLTPSALQDFYSGSFYRKHMR